MREYRYSCDQVMGMGYFEAYRLWFIADELRARDLQQLSLIMDATHTNEEHRKKVDTWLKDRQPRAIPKTQIPQEVLERFGKAWRDGRR